MSTSGAVVPFAPPAIGRDEIDEVVATLESGWLSTGPRVQAFEQAFAQFVGAPYAVAVNSCTAALHLALLGAEVGAGHEVITTPLTFCATANVVVHTGAVPIFADIDPMTWNLSPDAAGAAVTSRTSAVIPVHYAGRAADMRAFRALARRHDLTVIEDAAHAVESVTAGEKVGTTADYSCFSFYATKNLTTGEGGMLTTASEKAAAHARIAALHGMSRDAWQRYAPGGTPHYDVVMPGFKYNMMDVQAAIGLRQLARVADRLRRREAVWQIYDEGLAGLPLTRPSPVADGDVHARHLYTVLVDDDARITRDQLIDRLRAQGIATSVHFRALHLHPYYADRFALRRGMFPHAERVSDRVLSLPLWGGMANETAWTVVRAVRAALAAARSAA